MIEEMCRWLGLRSTQLMPAARLGVDIPVDPLDMVELLYQLELRD